ncbi:hypothetical protein SteCoe_15338 [Stentor coeruleus]|uniref:DED domain-containing protein n=1 Tax=Stentor coeruleus TaxID=5963 RepID=A0A1R2C3W5_9CILI|nr:hypothetical protein SteCoe_15338 [Stentor coeruleus]
MESAYQERDLLKESCYNDSNRFLTFSRVQLATRYDGQLVDEPLRASAVDARLATVNDKMKSLTNYSERSSPVRVKSPMWREIPNEAEKEYNKSPERTYGYTQVSEIITKAQSDVVEILKQSKKIDEMSIKSKIWEIFNRLSHEVWNKCFKNKHQDNDLSQENRQLRSTLNCMEEQMLKLRNQLHEKEINGIGNEMYLLKTKIKRMKEMGQNLQMELNQKVVLVQNQEKELSFLRNEIRNKDMRGKSVGRMGVSSDELREKVLKVTQERDSLLEWKNRFTQYPSTYEKSIQKIKEDHQYEKQILQESIDHLQNIIREKDLRPQAKTTQGFFSQKEREAASRTPDIKSQNNESKLKNTIFALKKEKNQLKESLDMVVKDYENVCKNFKAQSEEYKRDKEDFEIKILRYERKLKNNIEKNDNEGYEEKVKFEGIGKGKKKVLRSGNVEKNNQSVNADGFKERILCLESDKKKLEEIIKLENIQASLLSEKISQLTSQLQELSLQIINLESEKSKLLTKAKDLEILQKTAKSLESQNLSLQTSLSSTQKDLEVIKSLYEKSQSSTINPMKVQIAALNQELLNQKSKAYHLENDKNLFNQEIKTLKSNLDIKIQEIHTLENKFISSQKKILENDEESIQTVNQNKDLNEKIKKMKLEISDKNKKISELDKKNSDYVRIIKEYQDKEKEYKENIEKYMNDTLENIQKNRDQYKLLVIENDKEKEGFENKIKSLYDLIEEKDQKIDLQERGLDDLMKRIKEKDRENKGLIGKIEKLEEEMKKKIVDWEKDKEKALRDLRIKHKNMDEDLAELIMVKENLEKQVLSLKAAVKDAEKVTEDKITENVILNDAFLGIKEELQELKLKKQENQEFSDVFKDQTVKISRLELEISQKQEQYNKTIEELNILTIKDQENTIKLAKIIKQNTEIQTKLIETSFEKDQAIKDTIQLNEKIHSLNMILLEKSQEATKALQNSKILTEKINSLEVQLSSSESQMHVFQEKAQEISFQKKKLQQKIDEYEEKIQFITFENEDLKRKLIEKEQDYAEIFNDYQELKGNMKVSEGFEDLVGRLDGKNKEIEMIKEEYEKIVKELEEKIKENEEIGVYLACLEGKSRENEDLMRLVEELREDNKGNIEKLERYMIQIKRNDLDFSEKCRELQDLDDQLKDFKAGMGNIKEEVKRLEIENERKKIENNNLMMKIGRLEKVIIENEGKITSLEMENGQFNDFIKEKDNEHEKFKEENHKSIKKLDEEKEHYIKSINEIMLKFQNIEKSNLELKESLDAKEKQLKDFQSNSMKYEETLNSLEQKLQESDQQIKHLKEKSIKHKTHSKTTEESLLLAKDHLIKTLQNKESTIQTLETHIESLTLNLQSTINPSSSSKNPKILTQSQVTKISLLSSKDKKNQNIIEELKEKYELELQKKDNKISELEISYNEYKEKEKYAYELLAKHEKENMSLQSEIDTLFQEKTQLNNYIKKLKEDTILEQKINDMIKILETKENENLVLRDKILTQDNNIHKLEEDIEEEYGKIEEQTQDIMDLERKVKELNDEIKVKKIEIYEIVEGRNKIEKEIREKDEEIYMKTLEIGKSEEKIKFLQDEVNNKENEILELKESIENLNISLEVSMKSHDESIKSLKEDAEKAEIIIREKEKEIKDMKNVVKNKDVELKKLTEDGKSIESVFQNKIASLIKDIAVKDEEINQARKHNKMLSETVKKNSANENLVRSFEEQISRLQNANDDKEIEFTGLESAFNSQKEYLRNKQEEIDEIKKSYMQLSEDFLVLKSSFEQEKQSRAILESKLLSSQKEKNEIFAKVRLEKELLKSEIEDLTEKLENLQISNQQAKLDIEKLQIKISESDLALKERTNLISEQTEVIKDYEFIEQQKNEFKDLFEKEKLENIKLNDEITRINIENKKLKDFIKDFEVKNVSLQNLNDNYISMIKSLEDKLIENDKAFELERRNLCLNKDQEVKNISTNIRLLEEELQNKEKIIKEANDMLEVNKEEIKNLNLSLENEKNNAKSSAKTFNEEINLIKSQIITKNQEISLKDQEIVSKDKTILEKTKDLEELAIKIQDKDTYLKQIIAENILIIEDLNKKLQNSQNELIKNNKIHQTQLYELDEKHISEKLLIEQVKKRLESQEILYKQEIENLKSQLKSYSDEISKINDLRCKDIKDKNIEIQELKQFLAKKIQETNEIEAELQNIALSHEIQAEGNEGGIKSLWAHINQLNKQIEEKNQMLTSKNNDINDLNRKIDEANEQKHILESTKQALELKIKSSESLDSKQKFMISNLQNTITELQAEKDTLEQNLRKEILEFKSQKKNIERVLSEEKDNKITEIENLTNAYNKKILDLEVNLKAQEVKSNEKLNNMLIEKTQYINKSEEKIIDLEKKIHESSDFLQDKNNEISELKNQISLQSQLYETTISSWETKNSEIQSEKETLKETNKNLEDLLSSSQISEAQAKQTIINLSIKISEYKQIIEISKSKIDELTLSLDTSNKSNQEFQNRLQTTQSNISALENSIKTLEEERVSLIESRKSQNKNLDDEYKDMSISLEENDKKEQQLTDFLICKVVKYNNKTWCLVYTKNQHQEYFWYEKYVLKDIDPSIEIPRPYEEQLEEKISTLNEDLEVFSYIKELDFPEEFQCKTIVETIENMIKHCSASRRSIIKPISIIEFGEEVNSTPVSIVSPNDTYSDLKSDHSVKIIPEEINDIIKKMKDLEEDNSDLKNRVSLLNQQLAHFKNEGRSEHFIGKSDTTIENIRGIFSSILEKIPLQSGDVEMNIKVLLDILNISKEYKDRIMGTREIIKKQEKKGLINFFKKKKK